MRALLVMSSLNTAIDALPSLRGLSGDIVVDDLWEEDNLIPRGLGGW